MRIGVEIAVCMLGSVCLGGCIGYGASLGEDLPGYSETRISPGVFSVRYNAPYDPNRRTLRQSIEGRALELCAKGFSISDMPFDSLGLMHSPRLEYGFATATVVCRD